MTNFPSKSYLTFKRELTAGDEWTEGKRIRLNKLRLYQEDYSRHVVQMLGRLKAGTITKEEGIYWVDSNCYNVLSSNPESYW